MSSVVDESGRSRAARYALFCAKPTIRGRFANDMTGKARHVFKITLRVILVLHPCSTAYLYTPPPQRAVGHGAVSIYGNTYIERARAGFAGVPSFLCMCKEKTAYGALPIPNACLWYILQATDPYGLHMLYCVRPLSGAASGGTNACAYSTAHAPYRLFMLHTANFRYKDDAYGESYSYPLHIYLSFANGVRAIIAHSAIMAQSIGKPIDCSPTKSYRFDGAAHAYSTMLPR